MNMDIDKRESKMYELLEMSKSLSEKIKDTQLDLYVYKEQKKAIDKQYDELRRELHGKK